MQPKNQSGRHRYRIALRSSAAPNLSAGDDRPTTVAKYPAEVQFNMLAILHTRRNILEEEGREAITLTVENAS
jgi:hypothetical protein